ncbi:MAG TPA: hypothetical protein DDW52_15925 [Planctomycetaceae bacterium]|nr:hypothetical protein [Planctomycetaceae bacterium]
MPKWASNHVSSFNIDFATVNGSRTDTKNDNRQQTIGSGVHLKPRSDRLIVKLCGQVKLGVFGGLSDSGAVKLNRRYN